MSMLREIDNTDFLWIQNMLVRYKGFNKLKAERCITLYKYVLKIAAIHPNVHIAPPSGADYVMHLHILHTKKYSLDCKRIFGEYVHHDPEIAGTPEFWAAWNFTIQKLEDYFGVCVKQDSEFQKDELEPELCTLLARA
jgi:hypothetical protein